MEQAWVRWVWEGVQDIHSDNLDSEVFYHVKVTFMVEHQSMEFREVLNLKTEFRWNECWDVKKAKGWAPGILHLKHILYFQEPTVELSTHTFVQLRHQLPQSQWNPQFTQKSSIWVQVKGEGITLIFFSFFVWFIDFLSFWLSTGLPFQHLYCVLNKRGQFSSLKLLKAQTSIHRGKSLAILSTALVTLSRVPLKFTYITKSPGKQRTEKVIKLNGIS